MFTPVRAVEIAFLLLAAAFLIWISTYRYLVERPCARYCAPEQIASYGPPCTCEEPEETP